MIIRGAGKKEFVFTPVGVDETLLRRASFTDIEAEDVTANMAAVSGAWATDRDRHRLEVRPAGGDADTYDAIFASIKKPLIS
jgi:hypothetical protein